MRTTMSVCLMSDLELVTSEAMTPEKKAEIERVMQEAIDHVNEGMKDVLEAFNMDPFVLVLDLSFENDP